MNSFHSENISKKHVWEASKLSLNEMCLVFEFPTRSEKCLPNFAVRENPARAMENLARTENTSETFG
jgi:hypothetical protein